MQFRLKAAAALVILASMSLSLYGCQKSENASAGTSGPGLSSAYDSDSSRDCSKSFLDEYQAVMNSALSAKSRDELIEARDVAQKFQDKFKSVECDAISKGNIVTLNVDLRFRHLLGDLTILIHEAVNVCDRNLSSAALELFAQIDSVSSYDELNKLRSGASSLLASYRGQACQILNRGSLSWIDVGRDVGGVVAQIDSLLSTDGPQAADLTIQTPALEKLAGLELEPELGAGP